jgi:DNA-binding transcriptional LysR family regulator
MELRTLRYLVAVAEAGSISAAAERFGIGQPSLSRQLRAFEQTLSVPLIVRTSQGVVLTEAGEHLVKEARQVLAAADRLFAETRARGKGRSGELRIGYAPSPSVEILPPALERFKSVSPDVTVTLKDCSGNEMLEGLQTRKLHLAIMVDPGPLLPESVAFTPLRTYAHCVAVSRRHPFARLRRVPLTKIAGEPLVMYEQSEYAEYWRTVRDLLRPVTDKLNVAEEFDGAASIVAAVAAGHGVAVVTETFAEFAGSRIKVRPIHPVPKPLIVGYAHSTKFPLAPAARKLLPLLKHSGAERYFTRPT